jgi:hypothetical protein
MFSYVVLKNHITIVISREMNWVGHVECIGEARNTYVLLLVGKPEGNKTLGVPRCRWEDRGVVDLKGMKCGLQQEQVVMFCEQGSVAAGFANSGEFFADLRNH